MPPPDDADAFRALYAAHRDAVWRYAARRLPDPDAADDVTTEVFVVAWRRFDGVPDAPLPWLYGVARRVLANHRRASGRQVALAERVAGSVPLADAGDLADRLGDRAVLRGALLSLSDADRELLMLVAWEGLSVAEAATALGCRRGTAAVRLHRARKRLRAALDDPVAARPVPSALPSTSSVR